MEDNYMKQLYYLLATMSLVLAGCSQEDNTFSVPENQAVSFNRAIVTVDKPTTRVDWKEVSHSLIWLENDAIGIFSDVSEQPVEFNYVADNTFESTTAVSGEKFYAFYPYSADAVDAENNKILHFTSQSVINSDNDFPPPMVGISENQNFLFKQTVGLVTFTFSLTSKFKTITLVGNKGEFLAGPGTIDLSADEPIFKLDENTPEALSTSITIEIPDWFWDTFIEEIDESTPDDLVNYFMFQVPVGNYDEGFTIICTDEAGNVILQKTNNDPVNVRRAGVDYYETLNLTEEIKALEQAKEREALIAIYNALDGDNWEESHSGNWCSDYPVGSWEGIEIDEKGFVTSIRLEGDEIKGDLPAELGNLKHLQIINLYNCGITSLPTEISNLDNAQSIDLHNTQITSLPDEICEMKSLRSLLIFETPLNKLPENMGHIQSMVMMQLGGTQVSELPASLSDIPNLQVVILTKNQFTTFPTVLYDCKSMAFISIQEPGMIGSLAASIGNVANMETLIISNTKMGGNLPSNLSKLSNLKILNLSNNQFTGGIPERLSQLQNLQVLDLSGNKMSGTVSADFTGSEMWANLNTVSVNQQNGYGLVFANAVEPSDITMGYDKLELYPYQSVELGAKISPDNTINKEFEIEIEDSSICDVDFVDGKPYVRTLNNPGVTKVTVKVKGTDIAATCEVTVKGVAFKNKELIINVGESVIPEFTQYGDDEIEWRVNDSRVVSVDENGKITGLMTGQTEVFAVIDGIRFYLTVIVPEGETSAGNTQDFDIQDGDWDN